MDQTRDSPSSPHKLQQQLQHIIHTSSTTTSTDAHKTASNDTTMTTAPPRERIGVGNRVGFGRDLSKGRR